MPPPWRNGDAASVAERRCRLRGGTAASRESARRGDRRALDRTGLVRTVGLPGPELAAVLVASGEVTVDEGVHPVRHLALDRLAALGADPTVLDRLVDPLVDLVDDRVHQRLHVDAVSGREVGDALAALQPVAELDTGDADLVGDEAGEGPT